MHSDGSEQTLGSEQTGDSYGVLVGWTHHDLGDRLNLRLQCAKSTRRGAPDEIDSHYMMMTKNQAAILANYLLKIAGQTPPKPHQPSLIARIIGS